MDKHKSPEDILDEIMNRAPSPAPDPKSGPDAPPGLDPPDTDGSAQPPEPGGRAAPNRAGIILPWLCLVLGSALLVLGICVLQVGRVNQRLEALEEAVEGAAHTGQLREELEQLQEENERLQGELEQAKTDTDLQREQAAAMEQQRNISVIQKWQRDYLFYIGLFMDNGDYPMAAMVVSLSAHRYFSSASNLSEIPYNATQWAKYHAYCQELIDRGYLKGPSSGMLVSGGANLEFTGEYDPSQNPDMAALGILWCAVDEHYVVGSYGPAEQYLIRYQDIPLGNDAIPFPQRLRAAASGEIIQLYEQLADDLAAEGTVVIIDGVLDYGPDDLRYTSVLYSLPFDPPLPPYLSGSLT